MILSNSGSMYKDNTNNQMTLVLKNPPANAGNKKRGFHPWVRKILFQRPWQSTPVFFAGESLDNEAWQTTVHEFTELDMTEAT